MPAIEHLAGFGQLSDFKVGLRNNHQEFPLWGTIKGNCPYPILR